jgi:hypothetical protein
VGVPAALHLSEIPLHVLTGRSTGPVPPRWMVYPLRDGRHVPVVEVDDVAGMGDHGRRVGGDEGLAVSPTPMSKGLPRRATTIFSGSRVETTAIP